MIKSSVTCSHFGHFGSKGLKMLKSELSYFTKLYIILPFLPMFCPKSLLNMLLLVGLIYSCTYNAFIIVIATIFYSWIRSSTNDATSSHIVYLVITKPLAKLFLLVVYEKFALAKVCLARYLAFRYIGYISLI